MINCKNNITILKGIIRSGKSAFTKNIKDKKILSSDDLRKKLNLNKDDNSVFDLIYKEIESLINEGYSVVLDSTNLSTKRHNRSKNISSKYNASINCIYFVVHPYIWESRLDKSEYDKYLQIRKDMFSALSYPLKNEFDSFELVIEDIKVDKKYIDEFINYYNTNKELFIYNTSIFFKRIKPLLAKVFPELLSVYEFDQKNSHHTQTLDEHIFSVCANISLKSEEMIWASVLHDLGKVTKGIAQKKEGYSDVNYEGHAGASTEIAICVLHRFGFDRDFIDSVARIVNKHMYLPYVGTLKKSKIKLLKQSDIYDKLTMFRIADKIRP